MLPLLASALSALATKPPSFGRKSTWEAAYAEQAEFSWYCAWADLEPFWAELCPKSHRVLLPGVGSTPRDSARNSAQFGANFSRRL